MRDIEEMFTALGGEFISPTTRIMKRLQLTKAYLFDWDGVFNGGVKSSEAGSPYAEADVMGTNLIRFAHWLQHQNQPFIGIITGENNPAAVHFAKREHIHAVYYSVKNKMEAFTHIQQKYNLQPADVAYVFDDVLDVPIARECGLRFMVRRTASPLFTDYMKSRGNCDYITAHTGGQHAVREVCELIMGLKGLYRQSVESRVENTQSYQQYLAQKNQLSPVFLTFTEGQMITADPVQ